jgi:hypothetical protein
MYIIDKPTIQLWGMYSLHMMSKKKSCMLDNTQLSSTVEPGARGLHHKFRWSQPTTAFSGGQIGGGGPLVVHTQPAQLVARWWLQLPLQSSWYTKSISVHVARNLCLTHPLLLRMHCPLQGTRQAQISMA